MTIVFEFVTAHEPVELPPDLVLDIIYISDDTPFYEEIIEGA